ERGLDASSARTRRWLSEEERDPEGDVRVADAEGQREPLVDVEAPADLEEDPGAGVDVPAPTVVEHARVEEDVHPELGERRPVLGEVELPVERDRQAEARAVVPVAPVVVALDPVEVDAEVQVDGVV